MQKKKQEELEKKGNKYEPYPDKKAGSLSFGLRTFRAPKEKRNINANPPEISKKFIVKQSPVNRFGPQTPAKN